MEKILFANSARATLDVDIDNIQTSIALTAGDGAKFPAPSTDQVIYLTITNQVSFEVVKVTNITGDLITVIRGQDGTVSQSWLASSATVGLRPVAVVMENFLQQIDLQKAIGNIMSPMLHLVSRNGIALLSGAGNVEVARTGVATYIDRYGVLQAALANNARVEKAGLLIEPGSKNSCLQSQDSDVLPTWVTVACSQSPDNTISPDGTQNATRLGEDGSTGEHYIQQVITMDTNTGKYTASVFLKEDELTEARLTLFAGAFSVYADFNISTGITGAATAAGGATSPHVNIKPVGYGYWRCEVGAYLDPTNVTAALRLSTVKTGAHSYSGNGVDGLFCWGFQCEESNFATSYIPTTTTPVVRSPDQISITYNGNMPDLGDDYSIVIDFDLFAASSVTQPILVADKGVTNPARRQIGVTSALNPQVLFTDGGTNVTSTEVLNLNEANRVSINLSAGSGKAFLNGELIGAIAEGATSENVTTLILGTDGTDYMYGHIKDLRIYDQVLTDYEMGMA